MKVLLRLQTRDKITEHAIPLHGNVVIGRGRSADCQIDDQQMSGTHCRLNLKIDRLEINDLDSKNGTFLNGIRIESSEVFMGDEIKLGQTKITLIENKMDVETVDALTFPGPFKDRVSHELRVDFTGARIQNQLNQTESGASGASHYKEIQVRKKIKGALKLSKQEIKAKHKLQSNMAAMVDIGIMICTFILPVVFLNYIIQSNGINLPGLTINPAVIKENKTNVLIAAEVLSIGLFFLINFRIMKFTIGEKVSGIEQTYERQG